jgi:hypothetical protein
MMRHIMIDLETMGTRYDAPVLAIGAVYFNPDTGETGDQFYQAVDIASAFRFGNATGDTVRWWMQQGDAARAAAIAGRASLPDALTAFRLFCRDQPIVWGNGATFDISILEYAFEQATDSRAPWSYSDVRDCRTVKDIGSHLGIETRMNAAEGVPHHALDDARFQAGWVSAIWQALKPRPVEAQAAA